MTQVHLPEASTDVHDLSLARELEKMSREEVPGKGRHGRGACHLMHGAVRRHTLTGGAERYRLPEPIQFRCEELCICDCTWAVECAKQGVWESEREQYEMCGMAEDVILSTVRST